MFYTACDSVRELNALCDSGSVVAGSEYEEFWSYNYFQHNYFLKISSLLEKQQCDIEAKYDILNNESFQFIVSKVS